MIDIHPPLAQAAAPIGQPPESPGEMMRSFGFTRLAGDLPSLLEDRNCLGIWPTTSRTDAGAWFHFPQMCLAVCDSDIVTVASGIKWLGGKPVRHLLAVNDIDSVQFSDITARLLIRPTGGRHWPALAMDPLHGHAAATLIERLLE